MGRSWKFVIRREPVVDIADHSSQAQGDAAASHCLVLESTKRKDTAVVYKIQSQRYLIREKNVPCSGILTRCLCQFVHRGCYSPLSCFSSAYAPHYELVNWYWDWRLLCLNSILRTRHRNTSRRDIYEQRKHAEFYLSESAYDDPSHWPHHVQERKFVGLQSLTIGVCPLKQYFIARRSWSAVALILLTYDVGAHMRCDDSYEVVLSCEVQSTSTQS